ncbi:MAG: cyclic nucleotide-binding/CBS domain-containing protein, partial [Halobacteriaceae archaeon]
MDGDASLRDLATQAFVGVTESDSVLGTVRLMHEEGVDRAVVLRGSEPVGVVSAETVYGLLSEGVDLSDETVGAVMDDAPPTRAADRPPAEATDALANGAGAVLVTDDGALVGTVGARDIVAAGRDATAAVGDAAPAG